MTRTQLVSVPSMSFICVVLVTALGMFSACIQSPDDAAASAGDSRSAAGLVPPGDPGSGDLTAEPPESGGILQQATPDRVNTPTCVVRSCFVDNCGSAMGGFHRIFQCCDSLERCWRADTCTLVAC
ncbi:MAG: hypothetical protein E6J90_40675 [Deltaproteobacteria bacterium]|nr:MAG: hypothetical protein E6J90_40675 [Deltaproteobacteria bacterium]